MKIHVPQGHFLARLFVLLGIACALPAAMAITDDTTTCVGRTFSPTYDVCWSCMLPFSIGDVEGENGTGQADIENPPSPVCICPAPPPIFFEVGASIGFWEPAYLVEVPRKPWCFPSLGG